MTHIKTMIQMTWPFVFTKLTRGPRAEIDLQGLSIIGDERVRTSGAEDDAWGLCDHGTEAAGLEGHHAGGHHRIWNKITVTSRQTHGIPNHRQIDCLFNRLCNLIAKKENWSSGLLSHSEGNSPVTIKRASNAENFSMSGHDHIQLNGGRTGMLFHLSEKLINTSVTSILCAYVIK